MGGGKGSSAQAGLGINNGPMTTSYDGEGTYIVYNIGDALLVSDYTSQDKSLGGTNLSSTYAFASVEAREGSGTLGVRMHLDGKTNDSDGIVIKTTGAALRLRAALQGPTSDWWLMILCNMSTIM